MDLEKTEEYDLYLENVEEMIFTLMDENSTDEKKKEVRELYEREKLDNS